MTRHASMVPGSAGAGLGQQTGGTAVSDAREARHLLEMICTCKKADCETVLSEWELRFIAGQVERSNAIVTHFTVTGKQLFKLRDIKDKLVERGIL